MLSKIKLHVLLYSVNICLPTIVKHHFSETLCNTHIYLSIQGYIGVESTKPSNWTTIHSSS